MALIEDGSGGGYRAAVNIDKRLMVDSRSSSAQNLISLERERAFQITGVANLSSGTIVPLQITNTNENFFAVITYIRHQIVGASGGTAFPNTSNYFSLNLGRSYSSGGSATTPVNVSVGSGVTSGVVGYQSDPTLSGTAQEIDRWYTKADGDMNTYNKEGALILPSQQSLDLSYTGDHTSGIIFTRISFYLQNKNIV